MIVKCEFPNVAIIYTSDGKAYIIADTELMDEAVRISKKLSSSGFATSVINVDIDLERAKKLLAMCPWVT